MNDWIDLHALAKILIIGLIAGAGLPALFAVGLRALNLGAPPAADGDSDQLIGNNPLGLATAGLCFAVVLAAIGWGIYFIVAGT
jgi:hypothetical protein